MYLISPYEDISYLLSFFLSFAVSFSSIICFFFLEGNTKGRKAEINKEMGTCTYPECLLLSSMVTELELLLQKWSKRCYCYT